MIVRSYVYEYCVVLSCILRAYLRRWWWFQVPVCSWLFVCQCVVGTADPVQSSILEYLNEIKNVQVQVVMVNVHYIRICLLFVSFSTCACTWRMLANVRPP